MRTDPAVWVNAVAMFLPRYDHGVLQFVSARPRGVLNSKGCFPLLLTRAVSRHLGVSVQVYQQEFNSDHFSEQLLSFQWVWWIKTEEELHKVVSFGLGLLCFFFFFFLFGSFLLRKKDTLKYLLFSFVQNVVLRLERTQKWDVRIREGTAPSATAAVSMKGGWFVYSWNGLRSWHCHILFFFLLHKLFDMVAIFFIDGNVEERLFFSAFAHPLA